MTGAGCGICTYSHATARATRSRARDPYTRRRRTGAVRRLAAAAARRLAADQALPVPEIEKIVRDYLMREPEVIYEAIQELQKRQQAAEAATAADVDRRAGRRDLPPSRGSDRRGRRRATSPWSSSSTIAAATVAGWSAICARWFDADAKLRFVFKELPVLGPDSVTAAKAALAARSSTTTSTTTSTWP